MLAQYSDKKIGGSGMTVEIDESLFGKPMGFILCYPHLIIFRFNCQANASTIRERLMAIDIKTYGHDIFLVECPGGKRTREVLEKIIVDHVEVGTKIIMDG